MALMPCANSFGYSVLTHEEIVDLAWTAEMKPLVLARFPGLTPDQLKDAHAYAFGGSVIQDLGYYPFGSKEVSNLTHYVRSGDFVAELLREKPGTQRVRLCPRSSVPLRGRYRWPSAVNASGAIGYPRLRAKYGRSVTYAEDTAAHLKDRVRIDTLQVEKNRYATEQYHDFIGFKSRSRCWSASFPVVLRPALEGRAGPRRSCHPGLIAGRSAGLIPR